MELLWLIPALPFAGFALLALFGGRMTSRTIAWVGTGSVGLSALVAGLVGLGFLAQLADVDTYRQHLWSWVETAGFTVGVAWYLDALSLLMVLVITGIGFVIHLYSTEYMRGDLGYGRFFAYMNLFVGSMLTLVLADNLLLLYLGWEGVGLCSYLLIGFWYREPENGAAAQKAFIVTRIGDTALAVGLFLLFVELKTLSISEIQALAPALWSADSGTVVLIAALLLGGALGKSAQLPLQVWLPDAMAGPTPVSALIHAATMVTAGVYLIARMHGLFALAPSVQYAIAVVGMLTLLLAGISALVQRDIKRVLAYSTISQIGYMFLALGVGAWSAALFHFLTHACFKALLFLAAGAVILSLHHEQDIFRMGGLRRQLPHSFWAFVIGAAAMSGVPVITSGFYSKDWILWSVWSSPLSEPWLWAGGLLGAVITGLYSFRLVFRVFFGELRTPPVSRPGGAASLSLVVLSVLALTVGFLELPATLGDLPLFSRYLSHALPMTPPSPDVDHLGEAVHQAVVAVASLTGIGLAALLFLPPRRLVRQVADTTWGRAITRLWQDGWGFDALYEALIVRPWKALTSDAVDFIDGLYGALAAAAHGAHRWIARTQTGVVRWYAASLAIGALLLLGFFAIGLT